MKTELECEKYLTALIAGGCSQATAENLKQTLSRIMPHADPDLKEFFDLVDRLVVPTGEAYQDDTELTIQLLQGLNIPTKLDPLEKQATAVVLKKIFYVLNRKIPNKAWLAQHHIYDKHYWELVLKAELNVGNNGNLATNIQTKLDDYHKLYEEALMLAPGTVDGSALFNQLLNAQTVFFQEANIFDSDTKIMAHLTPAIKAAFTDFRQQHGLVAFLKLVNGDLAKTKDYLIDALPVELKSYLNHLSSLNCLTPIISASIGELISGKTIHYSEEELAKLTASVNDYFSQTFTEAQEDEQAIRDFARHNYLTGYDKRLATKVRQPNDNTIDLYQNRIKIKAAINEYAQDEIIAKNMLARGGQAQSANITIELSDRVKFKGSACALGGIQDELLYLKEEDKKYLQIKQNIYIIANGTQYYALDKNRVLEKISIQEADQLRKLISAGGLPERKPILEAVMRIDMQANQQKQAEYQVTDFSVKINTKDLNYDYSAAIKPSPEHQPKTAPQKLNYQANQLKNLGHLINEYASNQIKTTPNAAIRDFHRHDYIADPDFTTLGKTDEDIIAAVHQFAPNSAIADFMLTSGGQVLQAFLLEEINKRYLYQGNPIELAAGIDTEIKYSKDNDKVLANIRLNSYAAKVGNTYYVLFNTGKLGAFSELEALQLLKNPNNNLMPIFKNTFNFEIVKAGEHAALTVKEFCTELTIQNPAITLRAAKLSQDYDRLRNRIARLQDKIQSLNPNSEDYQQERQKLNAKINHAKEQQLVIDRQSFNSLFYHSQHYKEQQPHLAQLGNLQTSHYRQQADTLVTKNMALRDKIKHLNAQKKQILASAPSLNSQREILHNLLLEQITPIFNKAIALMKEPEIILVKRLTTNNVDSLANNLLTRIKENFTGSNMDKPAYSINLLDKNNLHSFLQTINDGLAIIDQQLKIYQTNRLQRGMHSLLQTIDKQPTLFIGSKHDKIQFSKNLKAYRKQLLALKNQLEASDYYHAQCRAKDAFIEEASYTHPLAQTIQQTIKNEISANKTLTEIDNALVETHAQLALNQADLNKINKKYYEKIEEIVGLGPEHLAVKISTH